MRIFLPLVTWIVLLSSTVHSQIKTIRSDQAHLKNSRFGGEVFFLNLEDGYFGCQVNESTDYLQLFELSKLCDGRRDCFLGADELREELKCTNDCDKDGTQCTNGVCLNGVCHCNDGFGGCNCSERDENECKYRPCDVFAHCINTLGSFTCTCFPGYHGNGFHCEDIDECQDPTIRARCVENAECCNLPAHYLCKCRDGYEGDGEVLCTDLDECQSPTACGTGAQCINTPGNYTCACPEGYHGDPYYSCTDIDECTHPNACGPGAICTNLEGGYRCDCPEGYDGDARSASGCVDYDECARSPCGRNAQCLNTDGSFKCICPDGYAGDPSHGCEAACLLDTECGATEVCQGGQCVNPCLQAQSCGMNAECHIQQHYKQCSCPPGFTGNPDVECVRIPVACNSDVECREGYNCHDSMCQPACHSDQDCALNEKCLRGSCMLTCRVDNDCFLGHVCLHNKCVYGCRTDDDCSASESCRQDKCTNPCTENPCGPNAACSVSNHRAICSCLDGMVPNPTPQVGCVRSPPLDCNENRDCPNGLACFEFACRPLCADNAGCLSNERCQGGVCKPLCRRDDDCRSSEVCLGLTCVAGCRSDQGCPHDLSCVNQQCINPCAEPAACGTNAECSVVDHRKQCTCPQGLIGKAEVSCKAPRTACARNEDCEGNQLCYGGSCQGKCRNDQNCLADERCMRGTCRTVCNTDSACTQGQICENRVCQIGCRNDLTCPSEEACINKKCKNPCDTPGQCGQCANCLVVNHGVQCSCPNGFLGDGLSGCQQPPQRCNSNCQCDETNTYCAETCTRTDECACGQVCTRGKCRQKCGGGRNCPLGQLCERGTCLAGCKTNNDCTNDQSCIKGKCADPCADKSACGRNALCTVSDHRMLCYCPDGYEGEPIEECVQFECAQDADCEPNKRCDAGKCRNPCLEYGACGVNAQCRVVDRKPQCSCPPDYFGTPETECRPLDGGCANHPCGANSKCIEVPGGYECTCMDGCMGDAHKGCVCEGQLVNACADQPCGQNAACRVLEHNEAQCYCPEEFPYGDAYVQCYLTPPQEDCRTQGCITGECVRQGVDYVCRHEIGCSSSDECPTQRACVNGVCLDPCSIANPCGREQECQVIEHQPVCSRVCECQSKADCHAGFECDGCHCRQTTGRTPGCEHCPTGTNCDPTTGACIKANVTITTTTTNITTTTTTTSNPITGVTIDITDTTKIGTTTRTIPTTTGTSSTAETTTGATIEDTTTIPITSPTTTETLLDRPTTESEDSNATTSKTGPPKGYRDGENNITASTVPEPATTTPAFTTVSISSSTSSSSSSSSSSRRGEDSKGPFDSRTTTPKMKTTRIDTSNEFDYNYTTLLTTTQRSTFPVTVVTEPMKELAQTTMGIRDLVTTMFPVITPPGVEKSTERPTVAGTTTPYVFETIEPLTAMSTPSAPPPTIPSITTTTAESVTPKTFATTESETATIPTTTTTTTTTTISTSTGITMFNPCTDHTNCGSNQLCVLGVCRNKCRDGEPSDAECVKGIRLVYSM